MAGIGPSTQPPDSDRPSMDQARALTAPAPQVQCITVYDQARHEAQLERARSAGAEMLDEQVDCALFSPAEMFADQRADSPATNARICRPQYQSGCSSHAAPVPPRCVK